MTDPDALPTWVHWRQRPFPDENLLMLPGRHGARRIFAFALMIRGGIALDGLDDYLRAREWFGDAARLLRIGPDELAGELVSSMTKGGAVVVTDGRIRAAAPHTAVDQQALDLPYPKDWV